MKTKKASVPSKVPPKNSLRPPKRKMARPARKKTATKHTKSLAHDSAEVRWRFPPTGGGEISGFHDPQLQHFTGDHINYIVREAIQNAVDARFAETVPVTVRFEILDLETKLIPDRLDLIRRFESCGEFFRNTKKCVDFFENAKKVLAAKKIKVLKISDFNTTGLIGRDSDRSGKWHRLIHSSGDNEMSGSGGGSFGIGKGAPFVASNIRTVFYSTLTQDHEFAFQGKARLVSHEDKSTILQGVGFCGLINNHNRVGAVRDQLRVNPFFRRDEIGTSLYVLGYSAAKKQNWLSEMVRAVVSNFWIAINDADLVVEIKSEKKEITIDATSLPVIFESNQDTLKKVSPYYKAFTEEVGEASLVYAFKKELPKLGNVMLMVKKTDGYPSRVAMARKPKMIVESVSFKELREPYAGVFLCAEDKGNALLRTLEPPSHDKWDRKRAETPEESDAFLEVLDFIRESLKSLSVFIPSEGSDILGLNKYLPEDGEKAEGGLVGSATSTDTGVVLGPLERVTKKPSISKRKGKGVAPQGQQEGKDSGEKVLPLIDVKNIQFRSFAHRDKSGNFNYQCVMRSNEDAHGSIKVFIVADDASNSLGCVKASSIGGNINYEISDSSRLDFQIIHGISLLQNIATSLVLYTNSPHQFKIGVA